jgi:hypothetical protein
MFTHEMEMDSEFDSASAQSTGPIITIGYYNLRGKAQVPRLLC